MTDPKAYAVRAQAARKQGLAPRDLIQHARPGAVFAVTDQAIQFPTERLAGTRTWHETRRVLIVQTISLNALRNPNTITVVPCSASHSGVCGDWDFLIPKGEDGFDATGVVAYLSLLQPVLKSDLAKWYGYVRDSTLLEIQKKIAMNLGLVSAMQVRLPPRNQASRTDDISTPVEHAIVQFRNASEIE